jgi:hypothetical protein
VFGENSAGVNIGSESTTTTIAGNTVVSNIDASGTLVLGENSAGVNIGSPLTTTTIQGNTIVSEIDASSNLMLGSNSPGVNIGSQLTTTTIQGNTVVSKLDASGTLVLGADSAAVSIGSSLTTTTIQGSTFFSSIDASGTLVLGENSAGVNIGSPLTTTSIQGNTVASNIDASGTLLLGTNSAGVNIGSSLTTTTIAGATVVDQIDAAPDLPLLLGANSSGVNIGSELFATTIAGNTVASFIDGPSESNLVLGATSIGVNVGSPTSILNFYGSARYNGVEGTEGQILTIQNSLPVWKTYVQTISLDDISQNMTYADAFGTFMTKSTASTATALQTFTAGISASAIDSTSTINPFNLLPTLTGSLNLAVNSGTIVIGKSTSTVNLGSLKFTNNSINSASVSSVLNIGTEQTSGILNIGTNNSRNGAIYIGPSANTITTIGQGVFTYSVKSPVLDTNVLTALTIGGTNASAINVGKANLFTNVLGRLVVSGIFTASTNTLTPTLDTVSATVLSIGASTASGITLGKTSGTTNVNILGSAIISGRVVAPSIDSSGTALTIGASAGEITIGKNNSALTILSNIAMSGSLTSPTGTLIIGQSASSINLNGSVNVSTMDASGALSIGTSTASAITLGKTGFPVNIPGNVVISGNLTSPNINTTGELSIGTSASSITLGQAGSPITLNGDLNLPTIDTTGHLSIGTSTATAISLGQLGVPVNLNGSVNTNTLDASGTLSLGTSTASSISIGKTGSSINALGNVVVSGNLTSPSINTTGALSIGTSASSITLGQSGFPININGSLNLVGGLSSSTIDTPTTAGILNIGTSAAGIVLGKAGAPITLQGTLSTTSFSSASLLASNLDTSSASALNIGTQTASSVVMGKAGLPVNIYGNMTLLNGNISTTGNGIAFFKNIDTINETMNIGSVFANGIILGQATTPVTVSGNITVSSSKSLFTSSIDTELASMNMNIGRNNALSITLGKTTGTDVLIPGKLTVSNSIQANIINTTAVDNNNAADLSIGGSLANSITLGRNGKAINVLGVLNMTAGVVTSNIDNNGTLVVGGLISTSAVNIGRAVAPITLQNALNMTTATNTISHKYYTGLNAATVNASPAATLTVSSTATPTTSNSGTYQVNCSAFNVNASTMNITTTGSTTVSTLAATTVNTTNLSATNITTPLNPTYTYHQTTGITNQNGIGYFYQLTITALTNIGTTQTALGNIQIMNRGVYLIIVHLSLSNNAETVVTGERIRTYLGWGVINNNNNNVLGLQHNNLKFGTTIATGESTFISFSTVYSIPTITSGSNYLCLSSIITGVAMSINVSGTLVQATRIA